VLSRKLENLKLEITDQAVTLHEMSKEKTILTVKLNETQQVNPLKLFINIWSEWSYM
jgi:hypothetical protein